MYIHPDSTVTEITTGLTGSDAEQRRVAADSATDFPDSFTREQADVLAIALVRAALRETDAEALASHLNALYGLTSWHPVDRDLVGRIRDVDRAVLLPADVEFVNRLLGYAEGHAT